MLSLGIRVSQQRVCQKAVLPSLLWVTQSHLQILFGWSSNQVLSVTRRAVYLLPRLLFSEGQGFAHGAGCVLRFATCFCLDLYFVLKPSSGFWPDIKSKSHNLLCLQQTFNAEGQKGAKSVASASLLGSIWKRIQPVG